MSKNKRMIYLWDENVDFYDTLENKSEFLNEYIKSIKTLKNIKKEDVVSSDFIKLVKSLDGRTESK